MPMQIAQHANRKIAQCDPRKVARIRPLSAGDQIGQYGPSPKHIRGAQHPFDQNKLENGIDRVKQLNQLKFGMFYRNKINKTDNVSVHHYCALHCRLDTSSEVFDHIVIVHQKAGNHLNFGQHDNRLGSETKKKPADVLEREKQTQQN